MFPMEVGRSLPLASAAGELRPAILIELPWVILPLDHKANRRQSEAKLQWALWVLRKICCQE